MTVMPESDYLRLTNVLGTVDQRMMQITNEFANTANIDELLQAQDSADTCSHRTPRNSSGPACSNG